MKKDTGRKKTIGEAAQPQRSEHFRAKSQPRPSSEPEVPGSFRAPDKIAKILASDQPRPSGQEWALVYGEAGGKDRWRIEESGSLRVIVDNLHFSYTEEAQQSIRRILDAHNAALAAATEGRDKWWRERTSSERVLKLEQQLAAEQEKFEKADRDRIAWRDDRDAFKKQLLAAQAAIAAYIKSNYNDLGRNYEALTNIDDTALREHDAEVRKPLVDLLLECRLEIQTPMNKRTTTVLNKIDDALAKVPNRQPEYAGAWERRANKRGQRQ